eukprot:scaffold2697_cov392-Prasinococcus_capsulatus_cf.AAC.14
MAGLRWPGTLSIFLLVFLGNCVPVSNTKTLETPEVTNARMFSMEELQEEEREVQVRVAPRERVEFIHKFAAAHGRKPTEKEYQHAQVQLGPKRAALQCKEVPDDCTSTAASSQSVPNESCLPIFAC